MRTPRNPIPVSLLGARLRALRKQNKLTQQAVADRLNIHRTTYTKYEAGTVSPDQQGMVLLSKIFGVSVGYLLGCEEPPAPAVANGDQPMTLTQQELQLLQLFRQLNDKEKQSLMEQTQTNLHK